MHYVAAQHDPVGHGMRGHLAGSFGSRRQVNEIEALNERLRADVGLAACNARPVLPLDCSVAHEGRITVFNLSRAGAKAFAMPLVLSGYFLG